MAGWGGLGRAGGGLGRIVQLPQAQSVAGWGGPWLSSSSATARWPAFPPFAAQYSGVICQAVCASTAAPWASSSRATSSLPAALAMCSGVSCAPLRMSTV